MIQGWKNGPWLTNREGLELTPDLVEGLIRKYLIRHYDNPAPIPPFHRELLARVCNVHPKVAMAAPRGHAKSTTITLAYVIACVVFRVKDFVVIISDTLDQATLFLETIRGILQNDPDLSRDFDFYRKFETDSQGQIVVQFKDGTQFCIMAMGTGQKIRGRLWQNKRPNLIVADDIENEEIVESETQRIKTRNWWYRSVVPARSNKNSAGQETGHVRIIGTILSLDSLLYRLIGNRSWSTALYAAHKSFDDFSEILWPEVWPEDKLRLERQSFLDDGQPEGYSQEMLNNPIDLTDPYFREEDMLEMEPADFHKPMHYFVGFDLAISTKKKAAWTVFVIGGVDAEGYLHIKDVLRYRSNDMNVHVQNMLNLQRRYKCKLWKCETGQLSHALKGHLFAEMRRTGIFLNLDDQVPTQDKELRARSIQGQMRAGRVKFHKQATWFPGLHIELIQFPKGAYKDQVDSLAWLGLSVADFSRAPTAEEIKEAEYQRKKTEAGLTYEGQSEITGY
jgi:predicted phage terminase large subunit-like protein